MHDLSLALNYSRKLFQSRNEFAFEMDEKIPRLF